MSERIPIKFKFEFTIMVPGGFCPPHVKSSEVIAAAKDHIGILMPIRMKRVVFDTIRMFVVMN
jgi:hypothetical protein